jgi:hypothetical protein
MRKSQVIKQGKLGLVLSGLLVLLTACGGFGASTIELPTLAGYNQYEGDEVLKNATDASGILATYFKSNPAFTAVAGIISNMSGCAKQNGIASWRLYTSQADLSASGVILIVSKTRLADPLTVGSCLLPGGPSRNSVGLSPCSNNYSYSANNENYWVFYAATKQEVCAKFQQALPTPAAA